jgi:hypothetical protein
MPAYGIYPRQSSREGRERKTPVESAWGRRGGRQVGASHGRFSTCPVHSCTFRPSPVLPALFFVLPTYCLYSSLRGKSGLNAFFTYAPAGQGKGSRRVSKS